MAEENVCTVGVEEPSRFLFNAQDAPTQLAVVFTPGCLLS
jgi:hypothetical protein